MTQEESVPPQDTPAVQAVTPAPRPRLNWQRIWLDGLFVMAGVLLALIADEWRQDRADRERAARALHEIKDEVAANRGAIRESLDYHLSIITGLRDVESSDIAPGALFRRGFIHPAQVLRTAWETGNATDAVAHLKYDEVLLLSRVYEQQQGYTRQSEQISQLIYERLFDDGFDGMLENHANLSIIVGTLVYRECGLISLYDDAMKKLGVDVPADAPPLACGRALKDEQENQAGRTP